MTAMVSRTPRTFVETDAAPRVAPPQRPHPVTNGSVTVA